MVPKYVSCFLPSEDRLTISKSEIPIHEKTIYDAVGYFEDEIYRKFNLNYSPANITKDISLRNIINLHDEEGIEIKKIKKMVFDLKREKHILNKYGVPNVKVVKTKENKILVFDGHHSIISYLLIGKKYLSEIPHLMVESDKRYFEDKDIFVFFGNHKRKVKKEGWRNYVVNWSKPSRKQIINRTRNNMGEVFDAIKFSIDF